MSNARILIVEDEQIIALDIQATLGSCGYIVVGHTDNGRDAILKAAELRPDLVMMDIGLKGEIDGIEAATQIRAQFDLPVIFLTAFANQSTLERAREAEAFGYILKPFEENDLTIAIEMALYKHGMEYKLRESESKFRKVVEHASDGIVLNDSRGNIIEWNPAMEQITGLKRSDVLGQSAADITFRLWPKETKSKISEEDNKDKWKHAVETGYSNPDQMTVREIEDLQGARRIIQSNGFAINTERETLSGVIIRDITESKRAEIELKQSETRYRELIELAADGVLLGSHEGIIIGANSYMLNLTGRTLANLIGLHVSALFDPQEIKNKPFRFDLLQKGETVISERNLLRRMAHLLKSKCIQK
ncbi:PAS domain S-box protein [Candidatus Villigracilis saccharophilus]|uniref:PAS domain S-box protein n=1 Tax=Candidatus Villigracilis saccharophilus TaxID=3140684 RepID=UPI003135910A|nr:PAS domain S-box protein [Anaerolineales bacterium]